MMILWISYMLFGTLCVAQINLFPQLSSGGSSFSSSGSASAGSGQFNQLPLLSPVRVSATSSAGQLGTSASAQVFTPEPYPSCLSSNPDNAVRSSSPFAYSLLEASFTNPFLKTFYNTTFNTAGFYDAIYDEVKETLSSDKSQILAGSFAYLFVSVFPRITPLLNAVSVTNALNEIQSEEAIVITSDKEDYIEPFLTSLSKAVSASDGSADAQARAVVVGLLNYLDQINALTYSKFNEFISILAGQYSLAIYSTCKPTTYNSIPKP